MNILKLIAQLTLDGTRFKAGLREAGVSARNFGNNILGDIKGQVAAAFGTGALVSFVKSSIDLANRIKDNSEQFNVTTREVQELDKVAREVGGGGFEAIGQGLLKLAAARDAASTNNDKLLATFNKYGVSLKDLQNPQLRNIDLMKQIAAAMANLSETDRADFADLFGKSGQKIIETLKAIKTAGPIEIISDDQINKLDRATEELQEQYRLMKVRAVSRTTESLDAFNTAMDGKPAPDAKTEVGKFYSFFTTYVPNILSAARLFGRAKSGIAGLMGTQGPGSMFQYAGMGEPPTAKPGEKPKAETVKPTGEMTPETARKMAEERERLEKNLAEKALRFRLGAAATETAQRAQLEKQLEDKTREMEVKSAQAEYLRSDDAKKDGLYNEAAAAQAENEALGIKSEMFDLLTQIQSIKSSPLRVDSLTAQGQLGGGRNIIVPAAESQAVNIAREALGQAKKTATAVTQLNEKIKGVTVLRGGV